MKERRKYERDNRIDVVRYAPSRQAADSVLKGITQNYSYSGLCFITRHVLKEGQEIVLKSLVVPNAKKASVRWNKDIGKGNYKVGLEFSKM
jgi:PilZ domain